MLWGAVDNEGIIWMLFISEMMLASSIVSSALSQMINVLTETQHTKKQRYYLCTLFGLLENKGNCCLESLPIEKQFNYNKFGFCYWCRPLTYTSRKQSRTIHVMSLCKFKFATMTYTRWNQFLKKTTLNVENLIAWSVGSLGKSVSLCKDSRSTVACQKIVSADSLVIYDDQPSVFFYFVWSTSHVKELTTRLHSLNKNWVLIVLAPEAQVTHTHKKRNVRLELY